MSDTLLAAWISAGALLLGVVLPLAADRRGFEWMSRRRRQVLKGTWAGTLHQGWGEGGLLECRVVAEIAPRLRGIRATFTVTGTPPAARGGIPASFTDHYVARGGFLLGRFLRMDYRARDANVVQLGSMLFELGNEGDVLEGAFVGFGPTSKRILKGRVVLRKED